MNYLYHWVPKKMNGDVLFPLNDLKISHPDLYKEKVAKYKGREVIMSQRIPTLNCLWNDVIHLTAVHPSDVKKALIEAGRKDELRVKCYQIDPYSLDIERASVYFSGGSIKNRMKLENFETFDPSTMKKYSNIPEATKMYYRKCFSNDTRPLVFHKVPHILYKGSIDISKCSIIEV